MQADVPKITKALEHAKSWIARHQVYMLDLTGKANANMRGIPRKEGASGSRSLSVPKAVFAALDGELVWMHDPEGRFLQESSTLFVMRSQLAELAPVGNA